jgi:dTDP-4-amino-4,6-dideoxygalactose transaminase
MQQGGIPFGRVVIGQQARDNIERALSSGQLTEGLLTAEFETEFKRKFGWRHAIATSSGTTAGEVVWAALAERHRGVDVLTPACAFVATASCLAAARLNPVFVDVEPSTLNLDPLKLAASIPLRHTILGIQFVATMGKASPLPVVKEVARRYNKPLVGDFCEAHGALLDGKPADHLCDAAIYSLYPAHLIVGVEGGVIVTNDDDLAQMCRSIKSHGRPAGSSYFSFERVGFNAKWSDLHAAVALESLANFSETFKVRRQVRQRLLDLLSPYEDDLILYRDEANEVIAPHAFPLLLRDEMAAVTSLYTWLENRGVECKTLFGSLPHSHSAFAKFGSAVDNAPVSKRIGRTGLHFGCHEGMSEEDCQHVASVIGSWLERGK